jgi:hypothetical protein
VARLIAGPAVYICDECVTLCATILAENPPVPAGPSQLLVRTPDGTLHGCAQESEWRPFGHAGRPMEWCAARGYIRGELPLRIVVVREAGGEGPGMGAAFPLGTTLTEDHARVVVEGMQKEKAPK